jgi:hypothetical protein
LLLALVFLHALLLGLPLLFLHALLLLTLMLLHPLVLLTLGLLHARLLNSLLLTRLLGALLRSAAALLALLGAEIARDRRIVVAGCGWACFRRGDAERCEDCACESGENRLSNGGRHLNTPVSALGVSASSFGRDGLDLDQKTCGNSNM